MRRFIFFCHGGIQLIHSLPYCFSEVTGIRIERVINFEESFPQTVKLLLRQGRLIQHFLINRPLQIQFKKLYSQLTTQWIIIRESTSNVLPVFISNDITVVQNRIHFSIVVQSLSQGETLFSAVLFKK